MYDNSLKYKWDNKNVIDTALKEGYEKGEYEKALDIARTFKSMGLPLEDIAKGIGLSIEEIEKL
jgi:predicted transposase/invertase (TIGR01784 family)